MRGYAVAHSYLLCTLGTGNSGYLSLRPGIQTHSNSFIGDVYSPPDITSMSYKSRCPPSVTTSNRSFLPSELNRQQQHMCIHHTYMHSSHVHASITRTCIHHTYMHPSHVHAFITRTCIHHTYMHPSHVHAFITRTYMHPSHVHASITCTCIHHTYMHSSHVHAFITCTCIDRTYMHP